LKLICAVALTACVLSAAEKKVRLEDLPPAVQTAVKEQTRNATLAGLSTEKEKGKTMYEVETKVNGKSRDLLLDQTGAVVESEEEVDINSIPAPARAAIQKRAGNGTLAKVEKVMAGSTVSYEATIRSKAGKASEYAVNADGTRRKED
jgi:uncharacterized protein with beta-barrel porin domain